MMTYVQPKRSRAPISPKTKEELLHYAQTRSADVKTLDALHGLPDQQFNNMDEVVEAVPQEPEGVDQPGGTAR